MRWIGFRSEAGRTDPDAVADGWVVRCVLGTLNDSRGCDALAATSSIRALALDMPGPAVQEVLVKSTLLTLNDAVATENFAVFHAKLSKPFRDQFPPEKLKAVFQNLIDKHAVFDAVVASG